MRYSRHNPTRGPEHYSKMGQKMLRDVEGHLNSGEYAEALITFANAHSDGSAAMSRGEDVGKLGHYINQALSELAGRLS